MSIRDVLSLAASSAGLVLSLVTLATVPIVVQARNCWQEGVDIGIWCRSEWGGGPFCSICGNFACNSEAGGDEECYDSCTDGADYFCELS